LVAEVAMLSQNDENAEFGFSGNWLGIFLLGVILISIGIAVLVIVSVVLGGLGNVGGIILIGPIPIIFGSGPNSIWLIAISIIITFLSIASIILLNRRRRKE
jgi:uncharacterized membrane protein